MPEVDYAWTFPAFLLLGEGGNFATILADDEDRCLLLFDDRPAVEAYWASISNSPTVAARRFDSGAALLAFFEECGEQFRTQGVTHAAINLNPGKFFGRVELGELLADLQKQFG